MPEFVRAAEAELAAERERLAAPMPSSATFRELAHAWLEYLADVEDANPATMRDYRWMVAQPGTPYTRGNGVTVGRIMAARGDMLPSEIGATDIGEKLLARHANENVGPRSVNKHRQVISAIFNFGLPPRPPPELHRTARLRLLQRRRRPHRRLGFPPSLRRRSRPRRRPTAPLPRAPPHRWHVAHPRPRTRSPSATSSVTRTSRPPSATSTPSEPPTCRMPQPRRSLRRRPPTVPNQPEPHSISSALTRSAASSKASTRDRLPRSSYFEPTVTVRVLYHREADGCWAESPDIDGWTVARATYEEVRGLVADGLTFAHAAAAEVRGEPFDENRFSAAVVEHFLPAPAQRPTPERDPNFSRPERLAAKNSVDRLPCSR
jgi:hypothetical protein